MEWYGYTDKENYSKRSRISINMDIHLRYEFNAALKDEVSSASNFKSSLPLVFSTCTLDQNLREDSLSGFKAEYKTSEASSGTPIVTEALAFIIHALPRRGQSHRENSAFSS